MKFMDTGSPCFEANVVESHALVFRGMHFQKREPQGKFVRSLYGVIIDYILDLRRGPTYGQHVAVQMRPNVDSVFVPAGCAHGYYTLTPATVLYLCTEAHRPEYDAGFHHSAVQDDTLDKIISDRDKALPKFNFRGFFDEKLVWHDEI